MLDNCEHLIGTCAKVTDAILARCPRIHVMATSREALGIGGEAIYRVPSMSLPPADNPIATPDASDAVALFLDRSRAQGVDLPPGEDTSPLVASICRRLDGMPLAIELAAARLRSLSLTDLNERLDQRFRLLTGGSRSVLPRQQTLRATVDWSYSLLSPPERHLLRRLTVFAEGFDLDAAEAVSAFGEIDIFEITDLLGSLVDKNLVVAEPERATLRYRLLETIRQFAAERLVESGEEAADLATRTLAISWSWPKRVPRISPGRSKASGSPGSTLIGPTCAGRWTTAPPALRGPSAFSGSRWPCAAIGGYVIATTR